MNYRAASILSCTLLCCAVVACSGDDSAANAAEEPAPTAAADSSGDSDTTFTPDTRRQVLPSDRIYFNLTQHEWYAKGQPLVHEGRSFMPAGFPVAASLQEMQRAGEYQGVEYYRRTDGDSSLYVPVSRGYWQVFRGGSAQR
jgi:hypothetical protein